ncbi:MAG: AmmeMemoRadiSam system protein B [Gammaproteobacteria bacterium]|jgi:hypothetical protein|nr:AmmeMemoRadiSam system protein B [Gammaproteobacteria bacterium]|tara:strand:- start:309 stop:1100 length:792 start_codon:yes stop_codon:yes gene_type:complete
MEIRQPAVAGTFYPNDPNQLQIEVDELLNNAMLTEMDMARIKAVIVPHAGYIYSGPVAATAYKLLSARKGDVRRVVLLGPSHRVPLHGIAVPVTKVFRTPLGDIHLDQKALQDLADLPGIQFRDDAHAGEHSLEVQLPFLQTVLGEFTLVPMVVGLTDADTVVAVLERFWDDDESLIVISSDLSHYHPYLAARSIDSETTRRIEQLDHSITGEEACGCHPLNSLLKLAKQKGLKITTLDLRNSGDTAGSKDQVVGYGSYAVCS